MLERGLFTQKIPKWGGIEGPVLRTKFYTNRSVYAHYSTNRHSLIRFRWSSLGDITNSYVYTTARSRVSLTPSAYCYRAPLQWIRGEKYSLSLYWFKYEESRLDCADITSWDQVFNKLNADQSTSGYTSLNICIYIRITAMPRASTVLATGRYSQRRSPRAKCAAMSQLWIGTDKTI